MAVILIYIVAAILSEIVFLVDESLCLSINFKFPLNAIVTPYVYCRPSVEKLQVALRRDE